MGSLKFIQYGSPQLQAMVPPTFCHCLGIHPLCSDKQHYMNIALSLTLET